MRQLIFILFCLASLSSFGQDLSEYRWKNRLIILVSTESNTEQLKLLKEVEKQLKERDILVLEKYPDANDLESLGIKNNFEGVLLIGKDGGIKLQRPFIVEPQVIFDLVDSMPMRKSEMRRKHND